ncbi:AbrB/MazE/SpoVT family DNA-binding domain-containing protein [Chloroflexota bacterium]
MPTIATRKLIKFGESGLVVTIPSGWALYYDLKPGDMVRVITNGELRIRPLQNKDKSAV